MKSKPELTFKHNQKRGRYGWLRLTPAYSLKMVERYLVHHPKTINVLDPFCGTGTTPLYAAYEGTKADALEINPFLVWLTKVKTKSYDENVITELQNAGREIVSQINTNNHPLVNPPPISNIERWWSKSALTFLQQAKWGIENYQYKTSSKDVKNLLYVSFCRTLIKLSNAAFNHQSLSFADNHSKQLNLFNEFNTYKRLFSNDIQFVVNSSKQNPEIVPTIYQGDARNIDQHINSKADLVITSPPYPNRMSYIRELRPYMYWLGYLVETHEAGDLDWKAIGGTWGAATSRLSDWSIKEEAGYYPTYFKEILKQIRSEKNKNGHKMANYVARYFEDIYQHFLSLVKVLNPGASLHYIIGNSTFYNTLVPVEKLYQEIMGLVGITETKVEIVRKRNSKKELYEFAVSGKFY